MSAALHRLAVLRGSINPADYPPLPRMSEAELFFAFRGLAWREWTEDIDEPDETHDDDDTTHHDHDIGDDDMALITIKQGGPSLDVEAGVYPVILTALDGPKTIYPANAPEGTQIFEWTFAIDDDSGAGREIQGTTSTASGPKSKMFTWLTALLGGKAPAVGQGFEAGDLVGRTALATIDRNEAGWPRIAQLTAIPAAMRAQAPAAPVKAPLNLRPAQRPLPVSEASPDLPF